MGFNDAFKSKFSSFLLRWNNRKNIRQMPWKGEKDPYKIWLSEIILQQTRVDQGVGYYQKFIEKYPTVKHLASATDQEVYKLWEGLGYYNRCRNLLTTARHIFKNLDGVFPKKYEEIIQLKGIGEYTAAAIASFAYNLPHAVVDGNVYRVLSRIFGVKKAIDTAQGKKYFKELAFDLLDKKNAAQYNQALMDFGAMVCKPANPLCSNCIFKNHCYAFRKKQIKNLPVKKSKTIVTIRWFYYLILEYRNKVYIRQRTADDIWKNLFEFVLIEMDNQANEQLVIEKAIARKFLVKGGFSVISASRVQSQLLSHQKIHGQFIRIKLKKAVAIQGFQAVSSDQLKSFPFPKYINSFLQSE